MDFHDRNTIEKVFPNLKAENYEIISPRDIRYNCFAFAVGDTDKWLDPYKKYYWPADVPREYTIPAFKELFHSYGYLDCKSTALESGFEKVALFTKSGSPMHAAKQLSSGLWASKIGDHVDIEHLLEDLNGGDYGNVGCIFKRPC